MKSTPAPARHAWSDREMVALLASGHAIRRESASGDVLIVEDLSGQGHETREVGHEPRISIFVPLPG